MAAHDLHKVRLWLTDNFNGSAASLTASLASVPEEGEDDDFDSVISGSISDSEAEDEATTNDFVDGGDVERVRDELGRVDSSCAESSRAGSTVSSLLEVVRHDYEHGDDAACDIVKSCLADQLKEQDSLAVFIQMMKPFTDAAELAAADDELGSQHSFGFNSSGAHTPVSAGPSSRSSSRSPTRHESGGNMNARERRQYSKICSSYESPVGGASFTSTSAGRTQGCPQQGLGLAGKEASTETYGTGVEGQEFDPFSIADVLSGVPQ